MGDVARQAGQQRGPRTTTEPVGARAVGPARVSAVPPPPRRRVRWALAGGLLVLSPVGAEYLVGYDTTTGNLPALLAGLLFFVPLYGAPALLLREVAVRTGLRWPGVLALAAALGVVQAGVVDQSLFSLSYRHIEGWEAAARATFVEPWGVSVANASNFLVGHAVWSFTVPIALVHALRPDAARRPWLRAPGLVVAALLYAVAALLVHVDHLETETDHASTAQVAGAWGVAALCAVAAFALGRRVAERRAGRVPPLAVLAAAGLVGGLLVTLSDETWTGVAQTAAVLLAAVLGLRRWSRADGWALPHVAAVAAGALVARAAVGFLVVPLGDVPAGPKYAHNAVAVLGSVLLGWWAVRRAARQAPGDGGGHASDGGGRHAPSDGGGHAPDDDGQHPPVRHGVRSATDDDLRRAADDFGRGSRSTP
ncbi:hypothetical protein [Cellulomonas cellasea]|uniref:Uncharacterized protein n=1 Tax=Cellulomonas cellasea TaxID=43670 RepID=A0A7W4UFB2_9CELL|nr:hypothetical protein [Cellulomonas cellasea]MBB2923121.1 hypothetical protein [Cellulomonas cellasea]